MRRADWGRKKGRVRNSECSEATHPTKSRQRDSFPKTQDAPSDSNSDDSRDILAMRHQYYSEMLTSEPVSARHLGLQVCWSVIKSDCKQSSSELEPSSR